MKILERYILKENFRPFFTTVFIITFILLLDKALDIMNLILEKNLSILTTLKIFGLSLPFILALSVPMAALMGAIMSFGRLSVDKELTAFKACGINIYKLIRPTIIAAILLSGFMMYFNDRILPETNYALTKMFREISHRRPVTVFKEGDFTALGEYTIYIDKKIEDEIYGVVINSNKKNKKGLTITAKKGEIFLANGGNAIKTVLYNGQMFESDKRKPEEYQIRDFKKFVLNIPDLGKRIKSFNSIERTDREMPIKMMYEQIDELSVDKKEVEADIRYLQAKLDTLLTKKGIVPNRTKKLRTYRSKIAVRKSRKEALALGIREYQVEIHKKYALAVACLVFVLLGIPVGMMTKTSGVGMAFSVSTIVYMVYYMGLIGGEELGDKGIVAPWLSMWFSNILFAAIGIYLIWLSMKGEHRINLNVVTEFFMKLPKKIFKPKNEYEKALADDEDRQ